MRQIECRFEADVLSAVLQSRWPERAEDGLREHVKTCAICSDVAAVAGAIEFAREDAVPHALPESGLMWWKAQMRARREALETVARPITAIQVAAFACALVLMGACIGAIAELVSGRAEVDLGGDCGLRYGGVYTLCDGADFGACAAGAVYGGDGFRGAGRGVSGYR